MSEYILDVAYNSMVSLDSLGHFFVTKLFVEDEQIVWSSGQSC